MENNKIEFFQEKEIRHIWHNETWYFSIIDIIAVLTDSPNPRRYWTDLKRRSEKESNQGYAFCVQLKLRAEDGRKRATDCANTEGVLRIIMSIPSPKAEPFKLWLAQVGTERLEEMENPEMGFERLRDIYKAKGYPDEWIERRLQTIDIRRQLTDEWQNRAVKDQKEYAILTAQIAKGTFGLTPTEHKALKSLDKENLRDHMTPLELIFTALSEETTRQIAIRDDAQGFNENIEAAQEGGQAAGDALKAMEKRTNIKVVSTLNYINQIKEAQGKDIEPPNKT